MFQQWWRGRRGADRARSGHTTSVRPAVEPLEDRLVLSANLLADVNQATASAFPAGTTVSQSVQLGDFSYFTADDGSHANGLWKTDGTAEGTILVKAVGGTPGALLGHLTVFAQKLVFTADDGVHGNELWISDGSETGTHLLLDINKKPIRTGDGLQPSSSNPVDLVAIDQRLFFTANDGRHGRELWVTNGTRDGTHMVQDIDPRNTIPQGAQGPTGLMRLGNKVFFWANDNVHGRELWMSDGTRIGTKMVRDINVGAGDGCPAIYVGDGAGSNMVVINGNLFFAADNGKGGIELWKTDGTTTILVKNLFVGVTDGTPNSSIPLWLTGVGDTLYFTAENEHGRQLWKSDGTRDNTVMLAIVEPANAPGAEGPQQLTSFNDLLFFTARTESGAEALWVTDGTTVGTKLIQEIAPPLDLTGALPPALRIRDQRQQLFVAGDTLYFTAIGEDSGRELWTSDGTVEGTHLIQDIRDGWAGSEIGFIGVHQGLLLFAANDGEHGRELWVSDGTTDGAYLLLDINTKGADANPSPPVKAGDNLFFVADDGVYGEELWVSDGDDAQIVADINPNFWPGWGGGGDAVPQGSNIHDMVAAGDQVFFVANDGEHGDELWVSDGTNGGTSMVADLNTGLAGPIIFADAGTGDSITPTAGASITDITALGDRVFFVADDGVHGRELWVSDGTPEGTALVRDINASAASVAPNDDVSSDPSDLVVLGDKLYFAATSADHGRELWVSDGTTDGTTMLKNINAEGVDFLGNLNPPRDSNPNGLTRVGASIFFAADNGVMGMELWRTDGTEEGTMRVRNINVVKDPGGGSLGSNPTSITAVGDKAFFVADDGVKGLALWTSDGTPGGTKMVRAVGARNRDGTRVITDLTAVDNQLYFVAFTQKAGLELWTSDGTRAGTHLAKDIYAGNYHVGSQTYLTPFSSNPSDLTAFDGKLYFVAEEPTHGRELWCSDGTVGGTHRVLDLLPGAPGGLAGTSGLTATEDGLYFSANDGESGVELWKFAIDTPPVAVVTGTIATTDTTDTTAATDTTTPVTGPITTL